MRVVAAVSVLALIGCIYVPPPGQTPFAIPTLPPQTGGPARTLMPPVTAIPASAQPMFSLPPLATAAPGPSPGGVGSRESPYPIGAEFAIGDWRVAIEAVDLDAWDVIRQENQFNNPPAAGR